MAQEVTGQPINTNKLNGLGGWLILVGLVVVFTPIRFFIESITYYPPIFQDGTWEALTVESSAAYHVFWQPLIISEIVINAGFIVFGCYLIYLFFNKKRTFPEWFIRFLTASVVLVTLSTLSIALVLPDEIIFDKETTREISRSIFAFFIWVPYMLKSKRVKATFVN